MHFDSKSFVFSCLIFTVNMNVAESPVMSRPSVIKRPYRIRQSHGNCSDWVGSFTWSEWRDLNPRPLGPEDWTKNSRDAFRRIWCCLLRARLLSGYLRSNASVRSRRGLGQRLGQSQKCKCLEGFIFQVAHPEFAPLKQRISLSLNRKLARFIPNANAHVR